MAEIKDTPRFSDMAEVSALISSLNSYFKKTEVSEFEKKMLSDPFGNFSSFFSEIGPSAAQTFFRLVEHEELLRAVFGSALDDQGKENLRFIVSEWQTWAVWNQERSYRCKALVDTNAYLRVIDEFDFRLNDIFLCSGIIAGEAILDDLYFRGWIRLAFADKKRGNDDELFVSQPLSSFILSINVLLKSLVFTAPEREQILRYTNDKRTDEIVKALDAVIDTAQRVRSQFISTAKDL